VKELVDNRELEGIAELNDESAKGQMRLVLRTFKAATRAPALVILDNLYKRTRLQTNFSVNTGRARRRHPAPRSILRRRPGLACIDHQVEVITRRSQYRLDESLMIAPISSEKVSRRPSISSTRSSPPIRAQRRARARRGEEALRWLLRSSSPPNRPSTSSTCNCRGSTRLVGARLQEDMAKLR